MYGTEYKLKPDVSDKSYNPSVNVKIGRIDFFFQRNRLWY
jgi:hypothetical protein